MKQDFLNWCRIQYFVLVSCRKLLLFVIEKSSNNFVENLLQTIKSLVCFKNIHFWRQTVKILFEWKMYSYTVWFRYSSQILKTIPNRKFAWPWNLWKNWVFILFSQFVVMFSNIVFKMTELWHPVFDLSTGMHFLYFG